MSIPILTTKLYLPAPPPKMVLRPRLIARLNEGLCQDQGYGQKLTLISAPAGFGKTTLLGEWLPGCKRQAAWLSLDEGDNDLTRFLVYFVAALRTIVPDLGDQELAALQNPPPPPAETVLTTLLNEIATIPNDFIFILDDYNVIESPAVDDTLTFIIEHLPQKMHLVITTREDPALPIPRLRARGQLTELRAADLRFTPTEAAEFLNRVMGLNLSDEDIRALDARTEGWIAGLQLAALSMQGQPDNPDFIRAFAGDHRFIMDYLVEEVLKRQPEPVRSFLIQTSILDRLNGPLCDAVTGQPGGKARLETLQRGNFFIIPLDDRRYWYRYHHLFADVLHMYLMTEHPEQAAELHRRASVWYEYNHAPAEAVRHALVAEDFARAADLIEMAYPPMTRSRQEVTLLGWLRALPAALVCERPVLCNLFAGVLLQTGELEEVGSWLSAAERWVGPVDQASGSGARPETPAAKMVFVNKAEFRRLPASIALHRAGQALILGDVPATIKFARRVLGLVMEDDHLNRGGAAVLLGLAFWTNGDLDQARQYYARGMPDLQRAGNLSDLMGCSLALADILIVQGRLRDAMHIYERALQLAADHGMPAMRGTADILVGMSELYREQDDLEAAARCLMSSQAQGEHTGLPQSRYRWHVAMAGVRQSEGDLLGALDLLDKAERVYTGDFSPNVRPIPAVRARVWAAEDRLGQALNWAHEHGLSVEDSLSYLHEYENITLTRIFLACSRSDPGSPAGLEALRLLDRLLQAARKGKRTGSEIEILVLQAIARQSQADMPAALTALERALTLAEPEGYVRKFVDEGVNMAALLREAAKRGVRPGYAGKLLSAFSGGQVGTRAEAPRSVPAPSKSLVEPLSQRELEILRLFETDLSGPEIAQELVIALSTVRSHTKSIYTKLNVNSRRLAVKRAVELGLI